MTVQEPSAFEKRLLGSLVRAVFFRGRRGGPWEAPTELRGRPIRFVGNSGARLAGLHFPAGATDRTGVAGAVADSKDRVPGHAKGIIVLAHPDRRYGKQWFIREGWIGWLQDAGFESIIFDFPVYGESRGGSTYLHDDVAAACHEARRLRPDLPVHVIGLSIGAFAAINGSRDVPFVESMVLESPYPTFDAWYADGGAKTHGRLNRTLARMFPKTYRRIDAGANIAGAPAQRILIAASKSDSVTPVGLTRAVAAAAPAGRTRYLELDGVDHLRLFERQEYRDAILETLGGGRVLAERSARPHVVAT